MDSIYTKQLLSNGLTLLTIPMPSTQAVTVLLMVGVGSRCETEKIRGLTHFLEHMPFKGTKKYPTALKLSSVVDGIGAEFNAFTGKEYTGFYIKASANQLELALDVLSQLVFEPLIDEKEMEKEKGAIIEEINMYEDHPMTKVSWNFETLLFGDNPLGWDSIGTKKTVKAMARKDFIKYMARWYQPNNMVLGIAGGINNPRHLVENYFKKRVRPYKGSDPLLKKNRNINSGRLDVFYKKTEQAHLSFGVKTFKRGHPDEYALAVLATILGGNMSSRLFMEVREKRGLAYYIKTQVQAYTDTGYLTSNAGTDIKKVTETIKLIRSEYERISSEESAKSQKELNKAKEFLKGRLILDLEDSQEVASHYVEDWLLEKKLRTPSQIIDKIDKVSWEDVARVAKSIFQPNKLNLAIIGPYKDSDRQRIEKILE